MAAKWNVTLKTGDIEEFEDAQIIYKNFNGDPDPYNSAGGKRYFTIRIDDPEEAQALRDKGWYVVPKMSREDPDEIQFWKLKVNVKYHSGNSRINPKIWMCSESNPEGTQLPEDLVGELDQADVISADLIISAFDYRQKNSSGTGSGISAYLREGWFNIAESRFAKKHRRYADNGDYSEEVPF